MTSGGSHERPTRSPNRADAMVWALSELMLAKARAEPRIRVLSRLARPAGRSR